MSPLPTCPGSWPAERDRSSPPRWRRSTYVPSSCSSTRVGLDHPRGAGLAVHLGAVLDLPTVGVTRRPLVAVGEQPELRRGGVAPLHLGGRCVAFWVCTRTGARPLAAHAGWRTSPETAARVVLDASTPAARTPVPLQEARRVAREARSLFAAC